MKGYIDCVYGIKIILFNLQMSVASFYYANNPILFTKSWNLKKNPDHGL